jgi:hypothetical protein
MVPALMNNKRGLIIFFLVLIFAHPQPLACAQVLNAESEALPDLKEPVKPLPLKGIHAGEDGVQPFLGGISLLFDNDFFGGTDDRYTSGLALAWTSAASNSYGEKSLQRKILKALSFLPTAKRPGSRNYLQFVLRMEMYSPSDITKADPPPDAHPYAGLLYLDTSVNARHRFSDHRFTFRLGLVGPATGVEHVQRWVHELIGSEIPQGWDTQLKNEPIVNLFYQYNRRLFRRAPQNGFGLDLSAKGGGGLGNQYIGGNLGLLVRIGYRLPDNYGDTTLLGGTESIVGISPSRRKFFAYAFLASHGFGVVRWLPTDGNAFTESRSGDRDDGFLSISAGCLVGYGRVVLSYRYHGVTGLSRVESIQPGNHNDFASIMFTVLLG